MTRWEKLRLLFLATTTCAIFFVLVKSLGTPRFVQRKEPFLVFPESVSLRGWQQVASIPVESLINNSTETVFGRHYRYIQNNLPLDIEMRYLPGSNGSVQRLVKEFTHLETRQLSAEIRQQTGVGYYGVFVHQEQASLSACINPQGYSTFNTIQFLQNQITPDVLLRRLYPWLLGEKNLRDRRCLWIKFSVPLKDSSPEEAYSTLEQVWFDWYRWWRPHLSNS